MKLKTFRIFSAFATVCWMLLIFNLSGETAAESTDTSRGFSEIIFSLIVPGFKDMDAGTKLELLSKSSFFVRKTAHFCIYGVLGILSGFAFMSYSKLKISLRVLMCTFTDVLFSVSDEWHQTFIAGRSGELRDVLIDSSGAVLGILFIFILAFRIKRLRKFVSTDINSKGV